MMRARRRITSHFNAIAWRGKWIAVHRISVPHAVACAVRCAALAPLSKTALRCVCRAVREGVEKEEERAGGGRRAEEERTKTIQTFSKKCRSSFVVRRSLLVNDIIGERTNVALLRCRRSFIRSFVAVRACVRSFVIVRSLPVALWTTLSPLPSMTTASEFVGAGARAELQVRWGMGMGMKMDYCKKWYLLYLAWVGECWFTS